MVTDLHERTKGTGLADALLTIKDFVPVIPVEVCGAFVPAVNALALYKILCVDQEIGLWLAKGINECLLVGGRGPSLLTRLDVNGADEVFPVIVGEPSRLQDASDYMISLNAAKNLCLHEMNLFGRRVVKYLIDQELEYYETKQACGAA